MTDWLEEARCSNNTSFSRWLSEQRKEEQKDNEAFNKWLEEEVNNNEEDNNNEEGINNIQEELILLLQNKFKDYEVSKPFLMERRARSLSADEEFCRILLFENKNFYRGVTAHGGGMYIDWSICRKDNNLFFIHEDKFFQKKIQVQKTYLHEVIRLLNFGNIYTENGIMTFTELFPDFTN